MGKSIISFCRGTMVFQIDSGGPLYYRMHQECSCFQRNQLTNGELVWNLDALCLDTPLKLVIICCFGNQTRRIYLWWGFKLAAIRHIFNSILDNEDSGQYSIRMLVCNRWLDWYRSSPRVSGYWAPSAHRGQSNPKAIPNAHLRSQWCRC